MSVYLFLINQRLDLGAGNKWGENTFIPTVFKKGRLLWVEVAEKAFTEERDDGNTVQVKTKQDEQMWNDDHELSFPLF